jgi:uncharacterized protein (TIGR03437 family)
MLIAPVRRGGFILRPLCRIQMRKSRVYRTHVSMRSGIPLLLISVILGGRLAAADFSYTGVFSKDDEQRRFNFTLSKPGSVTIRTLGYAGGVNKAGTVVPRGGFDPTLSLFDSAGALVAINRDGGCAKVAQDLVTSFCWDAYLEAQLPAGAWQLVLTQSENLPNGPNLADQFVYDGSGNFTANPEGVASAGFWDFFPDRRTGAWAVDIEGVDPSATPDNPKSIGLVSSASFLAGDTGPNTILSLIDPDLPADPTMIVLIDGVKAEVLYAGAGQINFVVPSGVKAGAATRVEVLRGPNLLVTSSIQITDASPALFTLTQTGNGQAAALDVLAGGGIAYNGSGALAVPGKRGTYLSLYGTGFGAANPSGPDGLDWLAQPVTATIGGVVAEVQFAGLAPQSTMGLQQINVRIPDDCPTGSDVPVRLQIGSHFTQTGVTVAIE